MTGPISVRLLAAGALCLAGAAGCTPDPEASKFSRVKTLLASPDQDERAKGAELARGTAKRSQRQELVPLLIEKLNLEREKNPWVGIFAAGSLETITGQDFGEDRRSYQRWRKWWYEEVKQKLPRTETDEKNFLIQTRAEYTNQQGELELAGGNALKALNLFREAIKLDGRKPRYHSNLGLALLALGDDEAAERRFDDAIAVDKNYILAYVSKGKVYAERARKLREAATRITAAIRVYAAAGEKQKEAEASAKFEEVKARIKTEEDRALDTYQHGIALDAGDELWSAHAECGRVYMSRGDYEQAVRPLERARDLRRNDLSVRRDLALTYYGLDQYYQAKLEIDAIRALGGQMSEDFVKKVEDKVNAMDKEPRGGA